jgi:hypothetical protein
VKGRLSLVLLSAAGGAALAWGAVLYGWIDGPRKTVAYT